MTPEIMKPVWAGALAFVLVGPAAAEMQVSFPLRTGASLMPTSTERARGASCSHGGRFNRQSWGKQAQLLASTGFRALALDFRGAGQSRDGTLGAQRKSRFDVLATRSLFCRLTRESG